MIMNIFYAFIVLCCCLVPASPQSATAADKQLLTSIDYLYLSSSADQVTFKLTGPYSPKVFTLKGEKPRVVFDFPNVFPTGTIDQVATLNGPIIQRIRVGVHKGDAPKTRVVFDLATSDQIFLDQQWASKGSDLVVTVSTSPFEEKALQATATPAATSPQPQSSPAPEKATTQPVAAQQAAVPASPTVPDSPPSAEAAPQQRQAEDNQRKQSAGPLLKKISFDTSSDKGEMVLFELNGFYPPIVRGVEEGLPRAVCDFSNTRLADGVNSINNVQGKYVKAIRVGKHTEPDKIRVVLDLEPNNNYDLQQVFFKEENLFVIIVNTITPPTPEKG